MTTFIYSIFFVVVLCFSTIHLSAQQALKEGTFIIEGNQYKVTKQTKSSKFLIENTDKSELKPDPIEVNGFLSEYIRKKITNGQELMTLVCDILGEEITSQLSAGNEVVSGLIYYRPDGTIINMVFSVNETNFLSLDDFSKIENGLRNRFRASLESDPPNYHLYLNYIRLNYVWDFGKMER